MEEKTTRPILTDDTVVEDKEVPFEAGDVVRFAEKEIHGLRNMGPEIFEYICISTPPMNFAYAYMQAR